MSRVYCSLIVGLKEVSPRSVLGNAFVLTDRVCIVCGSGCELWRYTEDGICPSPSRRIDRIESSLVRLFVNLWFKLAVQERYKLRLFLRLLSRSLRGIAVRPLPCNYYVIQSVSAFHGGNTGSNPVGDAKPFQELASNRRNFRRHKKAQL